MGIDIAKGAKAMQQKTFPVIDMVETGKNILRLREERGMSVRDLQAYFGFTEPQTIYKWQCGKSLPTINNLYTLNILLEIPMDEILVSANIKSNIIMFEQRDEPRCSNHFKPGCCGSGRNQKTLQPFWPTHCACGLIHRVSPATQRIGALARRHRLTAVISRA